MIRALVEVAANIRIAMDVRPERPPKNSCGVLPTCLDRTVTVEKLKHFLPLEQLCELFR